MGFKFPDGVRLRDNSLPKQIHERLRAVAVELSRIAGEHPRLANDGTLAVWASRLLALSMHMELGTVTEGDGSSSMRSFMKYRDHRGGYRESMKTAREIEPTIDALAMILKAPPSTIEVKPYSGIDPRNGWDTHIVTMEGKAVGFTDGPVSNG